MEKLPKEISWKAAMGKQNAVNQGTKEEVEGFRLRNVPVCREKQNLRRFSFKSKEPTQHMPMLLQVNYSTMTAQCHANSLKIRNSVLNDFNEQLSTLNGKKQEAQSHCNIFRQGGTGMIDCKYNI